MRSFICFLIFFCRLLCHNSSIAFTETISMSFFFEIGKTENLTRSYFTRNTLQKGNYLLYNLFFLNFLSLEHIFSSLHVFLGVSAVLLSVWNLSIVTLHWHPRIYILEMSSSDIYHFDICWKLYLLLLVQRNYKSLLVKICDFMDPSNFNTAEYRKVLFCQGSCQRAV